jgi:hypothetical protein
MGLTLLCRMGFTGSVSGLDGEALRASARVARNTSRACAFGEPGFDGFRRLAEEVWRIPHGPDGGNGNRSRTLLAVAFKP